MRQFGRCLARLAWSAAGAPKHPHFCWCRSDHQPSECLFRISWTAYSAPRSPISTPRPEVGRSPAPSLMSSRGGRLEAAILGSESLRTLQTGSRFIERSVQEVFVTVKCGLAVRLRRASFLTPADHSLGGQCEICNASLGFEIEPAINP